MDGKEAMHPHDFGDPALDCNCRCTLLWIARAALDADVLKQMQEDAHFHGLMVKDSKELGHAQAKNIAEFKKRYLKAAENPANTMKPLKNRGKSGIIELPEDPFYDGLSKADIATRYKKADGSNLLDAGFLDMPISIQREAVRGYDKAISLYGDIPPQRLKAGRLESNVFAKYSSTFKTITFNPVKNAVRGEAYATAIHEMTHHAEAVQLFNSNDVVKGALKKLEVRSNSRQADTLKMKTVGSLNENDWKDPSEVVAYAIERQLTGRSNAFTDAIFAIMKEKGVIK